jgi:hypothetical protein
MTIQFNCPKCNEVIGFDDKHKGKSAHCTNCNQHFIIPSKSFETARKVKLPKNEIAVPVPGFYHAVFADVWKLIISKSNNNVTMMFFIALIVCFKFFVSENNFTVSITGQSLSFDIYVPLGWVLWGASWGILFSYYMEMIYSVAFDENELPEFVVGGIYLMFNFFWKIFQSLYTIFTILLVLGAPYLITALIFRTFGIEQPVILYIILFAGLLLSPMAILNMSVGRDLMLLRPDYLLIPVFRAFWPFVVTALFLGAAIFVETLADQYSGQPPALAARHLGLNLLAQFILFFAMRSIGLFARHYSCYFPW